MTHTKRILFILAGVIFLIAACRLTLPNIPFTFPTSVPKPGAGGCLDDAALEPTRDGLGDPYFPTLGNGGYNVETYDLDLNVDMNSGVVTAKIILTARATALLESFSLDFGGPEVTNLKVQDGEFNVVRSGSEMLVIPEVLIREGDEFTVLVEYQGVPQNNSLDEPGYALG